MRDEGSAVAGSNYSLICEVTIPPLSDIITVTETLVIWTYPSGETQRAIGNSTQLLFSSHTSHDDGVYTCTASYFANETTSLQASSDYNVTFSKSECCISVSCVWVLDVMRTVTQPL